MSMILLPDNLTSRFLAGRVKNFRINGALPEKVPVGVDFQTIAKYLNRLSIIKPFSEGKIHLKLVISQNKDFSDPLATITTESAENRVYFRVFTASNEDELCGWSDFDDPEGIGPQYNSKPIYFNIVDFLMEKCNLAFTPETIVYVKYCWFNRDEEDGWREIVSDWYSMVFPSMAEVGANSSDAVLRRDLNRLREELVQRVMISQKDDDGYWVINPGMNQIPEALPLEGEEDVQPMFVLKNYTDSAEYKIKFTVGPKPTGGETNLEIRIDKEEVESSGPVRFGDTDPKFSWNADYYVTINMGALVANKI